MGRYQSPKCYREFSRSDSLRRYTSSGVCKYQTSYGQIRYLMKRLNTVLSNKLQESKPSRFYSVRNTEKLQEEQKKGRLTNPSHRPKQQRFLQKKRKDDDIQEPSWNVAQKQKKNY